MGYGWVVVQIALFVLYGIALVLGSGASWGAWRWLGIPLLAVGAWVGLAALRMHGRRLTPLPEPNPALGLLRTGVYARVRHPMYTGLLLSAFGLAIVAQKPLAIAAAVALTVFFNLKAREEERRLRRCYPDYADYQRATGRFLPRWRQ
ncbi:MAG: methyltransferase [Armatimonadota bacterium]|nr:methyltransferase [Armatimonadota bacterium]